MNAINWFEIPTTDLDRAARFYGAVLGKELRRDNFGGTPHAFLPSGERSSDGKRAFVGGALIFDAKRKPAATGTTVYVNVGTGADAINAAVGRVAAAGGKVLLQTTDIGDPGFIAVVEDSEGNHTGLHAEKNEEN